MLRIRYKSGGQEFEYNIEKRDIPTELKRHLKTWGKCVMKPNTLPDANNPLVDIPLSEFIAEWIEGDPKNPTLVESIPIPGA